MTTAHIEQTGSPLAEALAKFQASIPTVTLDGDNPHFKSKFTTLSNLTNVVLPKLSEVGLAYSATPRVTPDGFVLEAHLLHTSGEKLSASFPITETNPQKVGSAVTYFRRYALAALTGVVADLDDDGNAASTTSPAERKIERAKSTPAAPSRQGSLKSRIQSEFVNNPESDVTIDTVKEIQDSLLAANSGLKGDDLFAAIHAALVERSGK